MLPLAALAQTSAGESKRTLNVVCVGAHPDDPESGCGGTLRKFAAAGHRVTIVYLTRGEAGIAGKSHTAAATIRTEEANRACRLLGANARFFGQIDGATVFDSAAVKSMQTLLEDLQPDVVFAHWPIDNHPDHQVAATLSIQARLRLARKFELYFYEVCIGEQSLGFHPTDHVDITDVRAVKRDAVFCHTSQDPAAIYGSGHHALMEDFRGGEFGVAAAEGFVRLTARGAHPLV